MPRFSNFLFSIALASSSFFSFAECMSLEDANRLASLYPNKAALDLPPQKTLDEAYCSQARYVQAIQEKWGEVEGKQVGYKIGFTGKAGQKKFDISHPAIGILLDGMIEENEATLSFDFGYRPMIEPDLLVFVKDEHIMQADNLLDVAKSLTSIHAFIEMPTIQFRLGKVFTSRDLIALNVGATKMIMGEGVEVQATPAFLAKIAAAQTAFFDDSGKMIQSAPLSNLMEHPFHAVLWLVEALKAQGKTLKKGDYISLGAVGRLFPLFNETKTYTYRINGLSNAPIMSRVTVKASN